MILACPECSARFAVPDTLMPPEGRRVKCGRCAYQWHAAGVEPAEGSNFADLAQAAAEDAPPMNPSLLPVRQKPPIRARPFMVAAAGLAACWLVLAFLAYYPGWMKAPVLGGIYGAFGTTSSEGLAFEDVTMQRTVLDNKKTQFLLAGSVINRDSVARMVPTVRVQLKNAQDEILWARDYQVNEALEPGAPYAFRIDNVETSFADSVASIALDVGHPLQLMMR